MDFRIVLKRSIAAAVSVFVLAVVVQFFVSCGSDYEKPSTTQTQSALISASTLKSWMDAGKVNGTGYDRVVILDVTTYGTYTVNHIPGALFVDSAAIAQDRLDGVGVTSYEVLDGPTMDKLVQKYGIDGNTTIVFTGPSLVNPARAYFTFRYWGFSKNRLKVLDGLSNGPWKTSYGLTPGLPPVVASSAYSVTSNRVLRDDLRVSLAEMLDYADGKAPGALVIDVRSPATSGSYAGVRGSTPGVFNPGGDNSVFEGRIKGAKALAGNTLYNADNTFKTVDQLITAFTSTSVGLDSTKTAYLSCLKGSASSVTFFILDGILSWPAAVYDGSWSQWGQLSGNKDMKGQLDLNSPWRTDIPSRSDLVVYNYPVVSAPSFTGIGPNDLVTGKIYSGTTNSTFVVTIDSAGTGTIPDTFSWTVSGSTLSGAYIPITGSAQALVSGVTVSYATTTGHTLNDSWTFTASAGKPVEQLTADGNVCSATYSTNGNITILSNGVQSTGSADCKNVPNSFDTDGNRIEEEDRAYMQSGGSGGSGGGTSVPAGC